MGLVIGCEEPEPAGVSLADIAGEWRAAEPLAMERPDSLRVGEDGTGTAILVWQMMGSLWEVELDVAFEVGNDDFDATFTCTGDDCSEYDFEARCVRVDDELRCDAPDWYWDDRLVFVPLDD